jgi:NADH-quinone oxidoreductase subunit E
MPLSEKAVALIEQYKARYPHPRSALMPALWVAQEDYGGYLPKEALYEVARVLDLTPADVESTCSFYSMYNKRPVGKYMIEVCTNIACSLMGGRELFHHVQGRLKVAPGEVTPDGLFTVKHVECMAACGGAPSIQVNGLYHENMSPEKFDRLIDALRAENDAGSTNTS